MEFRLLYFEGCPGWEETARNLDRVLFEFGLGGDYEKIDVGQENPPQGFYRSPTINFRRDSSDEWADLFGRNGDPVMACRPYIRGDGPSTAHIPKKMLKSQIVEILRNG